MKKNKRNELIQVTVALLLLVVICMFVLLINKPKVVEVAGNTAVIRLPGEFDDEAKILYNSKYADLTECDSILTITFKKQGYYECSVGRNRYVFAVFNLDSQDYTVDLLAKEYNEIMLSFRVEMILYSLILWLICVLVWVTICALCCDTKIKKSQ